MKNKWQFLLQNEWRFYENFEGFSVELFGLNLQKNFICITVFGFSFIWEK